MPPFKCVFNPIGVRVYAPQVSVRLRGGTEKRGLLLREFTRSHALLVNDLKGWLCPVFKGGYPESRFARLCPVFKGAYLKLGYIR
jgi:hypothetical protein